MPDAQGRPTPGEAARALGYNTNGPNEPPGHGCLWFIVLWIAIALVGGLFVGRGNFGPPATEDQPSEQGTVQPGLLDTWAGKVTRSPGKKTSNIVIVVHQARPGQLVGTLTHGKCRADLKLESAHSAGLMVSEVRYGEKKWCIGSGKIGLDLHQNRLALKWANSKASERGDLKRK